MLIAKVIGNLVSTHKNEKIKGKKLLFVQPLDEELKPYGEELLAADIIGAGIGDIVLVMCEGKSARTISKTTSPIAPVDRAIAGIIDSISTDKGYIKLK